MVHLKLPRLLAVHTSECGIPYSSLQILQRHEAFRAGILHTARMIPHSTSRITHCGSRIPQWIRNCHFRFSIPYANEKRFKKFKSGNEIDRPRCVIRMQNIRITKFWIFNAGRGMRNADSAAESAFGPRWENITMVALRIRQKYGSGLSGQKSWWWKQSVWFELMFTCDVSLPFNFMILATLFKKTIHTIES